MKFILILIAFTGDSVTTISINVDKVTTMQQCEYVGEEVAKGMRKKNDAVHFICHEVKK